MNTHTHTHTVRMRMPLVFALERRRNFFDKAETQSKVNLLTAFSLYLVEEPQKVVSKMHFKFSPHAFFAQTKTGKEAGQPGRERAK